MIYIDLKNTAQYFNSNFLTVVVVILFIEFLLGATNKIYANSIVELFLRFIGWTTLKTFRLRGKTLNKKKGVRSV